MQSLFETLHRYVNMDGCLVCLPGIDRQTA